MYVIVVLCKSARAYKSSKGFNNNQNKMSPVSLELWVLNHLLLNRYVHCL